MVCQLVDQTTQSWKTVLINETFEHDFAVAILSIHLPPTPRPDTFMWLPNSKGRFFVKAAFQIASNLTQLNPQSDVPWNKIWKLKVPGRLKMLIWRIGANAIPTKENFLQKINVDNPNYKMCNQEIASCEDIINPVLNPPRASCPTEYSWMISLNMVIVLDEIWQLRNRISYQDEQVDILKTIRQVNYRFNELSRFFSTENPTPPLPIQHKWEPPPQFWIKLNMDAAIVENWSTLVVVARDD
ncbi:uncharacterized protein LOC142620536 [Castanea sativa]|uniref:uncharacterized protein LOC142620536 n=1 Tax=Castanea sativa TaxID=21020 RepID=UPI003F65441E